MIDFTNIPPCPACGERLHFEAPGIPDRLALSSEKLVRNLTWIAQCSCGKTWTIKR